ncbi:hypothetical protein JCM11957_10780 [Caminibacter profundus]
MFNIKTMWFLDNKEQKYLKKLLTRINNPHDKELLKSFLNASSFKEIKQFLKKQTFIQCKINIEEFDGSLNSLKEKIAYELNEAILQNS